MEATPAVRVVDQQSEIVRLLVRGDAREHDLVGVLVKHGVLHVPEPHLLLVPERVAPRIGGRHGRVIKLLDGGSARPDALYPAWIARLLARGAGRACDLPEQLMRMTTGAAETEGRTMADRSRDPSLDVVVRQPPHEDLEILRAVGTPADMPKRGLIALRQHETVMEDLLRCAQIDRLAHTLDFLEADHLGEKRPRLLKLWGDHLDVSNL